MQENGFKEETERTSKNNSVDEGLLKLSQGIKAIRKGLFEEGMSASNTYYLAFKKTNFTEEQASISPRVRMRVRFAILLMGKNNQKIPSRNSASNS